MRREVSRMQFFIPFACILILSSATDTEFEEFKTRFEKNYKNTAEEELRQKIFHKNLDIIDKHNALHKQGKVTYDLAINQFADLTAKEFSTQYHSVHHDTVDEVQRPIFEIQDDPVPDSIDWRDLGCVTPVKDQGQCGSSCIFSVTGSIEGQYCIETGTLVSIGYQPIVDCCAIFGLEACSACFMDDIYECLITLEHRTNDSLYSNVQENEICGADELTAGAVVNSYVDIPSKNEDALKNTTAIIGPIAAAIDASHASFQLYNSGVYYEPACFEEILDHDVLVVGYGAEGGLDYWLVKNSWGTSWGEQGYIKMSRNKDNNCGIATEASYPVLEV